MSQLHDYMLDDAHIRKALQMKITSEVAKKEKLEKREKKEKVEQNDKVCINKTLFAPAEQDSLFWCYFIMANGDAAYEILNNKNSLLAKQMKIDLVTLIRKSKDIIKTYKFDTITNIESNLANDAILNAKTFLTLCVIANINVIYISKKTYFESFMNDTDIVYIVREQTQTSKYVKKYAYEMGNQEMIQNIRQTFYKLDKIDKPIKALSAYKVEELVGICQRLAIEFLNKDSGKTKSKKDLYEAIVQYF
jgi:hypothetical protein